MALLRDPKDRDIVIESSRLTEEDEKAITAFIKAYKLRSARAKAASKKRKKDKAGNAD